MRRTLSAALGRYATTKALFDGTVASPEFTFDFADVSPISRAFAPMVREQRYDVSEMAIATVLLAIAAGKPIVLLPVAVAARFQEQALLCRMDSTIAGPGDLRGRRIGVRSYSQTTGMWLRGILRETEALDPADMAWTVFEGAHVVEYADPPWVKRAPAGAELMSMLRDGTLDAAIVGNDVPRDDAFRTVFAEPEAAGSAFLQRHGFMPVNHLVVVRRDLAQENPDLVPQLVQLFTAAQAAAAPGAKLPPLGRDALRPVFDLALRFATEQGMLSRPLREEDLWRQ